MKSKKVPVIGFALHTGYVESANVGLLLIRSTKGKFDSPKEAMTDLAHYLLDDFMNAEGSKDAYLDEFTGHGGYIHQLPTCDASSDRPFCPYHWNDESWWPWLSLEEVAKELHMFYENQEPLEHFIAFYLDRARLISGRFRDEVIKFQDEPHKGNLADENIRQEVAKGTVLRPVMKAPKKASK